MGKEKFEIYQKLQTEIPDFLNSLSINQYEISFFDRLLEDDISKFKGTSFVFFNNTYGIAGIKNALYLKEIEQKRSTK